MSRNRLIIIIVLAQLLLLLTYKVYTDKQNQAKPIKQTISACSANAEPCIEIKLETGQIFKLNDFRLVPNRCILFTSLPDKQTYNYCGHYELHWIKPDTIQNKRNV